MEVRHVLSHRICFCKSQTLNACWKNFPTKYNTLTTSKNVPKKTVPIIAFTIVFTLDIKIAWFGSQMAVFVKVIQMQFFGVVNFKSSTLAICCLISCLFYVPNPETISKLLYSLWTGPSIIIIGTQI